MERKYTYEPEKISENSKDRMRFELGDTMVEGGADTSALADAEITAALEMYPGKWKRARITVQYHPGIANVTNHFFLPAEEVAAGEWEVRWTKDMKTVYEYEG